MMMEWTIAPIIATLLAAAVTAAVGTKVSGVHPYPVPSALPPNSWGTVGGKLFMHGCNKDGLFDSDGLKLASKFSFLTVEKGQGLNLPGFADDKMAALAAQWKAARRKQGKPEGWAMFYLNAKLDWTFYRLHAEMLAHTTWPVQRNGATSGEPRIQTWHTHANQPLRPGTCLQRISSHCTPLPSHCTHCIRLRPGAWWPCVQYCASHDLMPTS